MRSSQRGLDDIIRSEGEKLVAYRDRLTRAGGTYLDVWTIGVGHTSSAGPPAVTPSLTITHEQSREILSRDIKKVEERVAKAFKGHDLPQNVFDGAVSFDFNTGGIMSASWVTAWLNGDLADAERRFLLWNKPPEIIGRRKREADLIFRGRYQSPPPKAAQPDPKPAPAPLPPAVIAPATVAAGAMAGGLFGGDTAHVLAIGFVAMVVVGVLLYVFRRR